MFRIGTSSSYTASRSAAREIAGGRFVFIAANRPVSRLGNRRGVAAKRVASGVPTVVESTEQRLTSSFSAASFRPPTPSAFQQRPAIIASWGRSGRNGNIAKAVAMSLASRWPFAPVYEQSWRDCISGRDRARPATGLPFVAGPLSHHRDAIEAHPGLRPPSAVIPVSSS